MTSNAICALEDDDGPCQCSVWYTREAAASHGQTFESGTIGALTRFSRGRGGVGPFEFSVQLITLL